MKKFLPLIALSLALAGAARADDMTDAEVRRVDKDAGKLTLKHGEIRNLEMPPMTMVFGVKDPSMLDRIKPGDRIRFKAVSEDGRPIVTEIQDASTRVTK